MHILLIFVLACLLCFNPAVTKSGLAASKIEIMTSASSGSDRSDAEVRKEFLERVKRIQDPSAEKEHWIQIYIGLTRHIKDVQQLSMEYEQKKDEAQSARVRSVMRSHGNSMTNRLNALEVLRALAVKQHALLEELENLEVIHKKDNLSTTDYLQRKQNLVDKVIYIENQRQWLNIADDMFASLESIERAILTLD